MNYDDGKENFRVELPTRVMKSVRFNPMHAKLVAVEMISEYGSPITIKRNNRRIFNHRFHGLSQIVCEI